MLTRVFGGIIITSWFLQGAISQFYPGEKGVMSPRPQTPPGEKVFCRFRNKEYSPGDMWYPPTSPHYGPSCVGCTCLMTGRQNCTRQDCPTDCHLDKPSHLQHPCCKFCEDRDSDSSQSGGVSPRFGVLPASEHESGEEEDEDGDLVTENSEFVSCLHQGKIYRDGEAFTANVTGLPIHATDQCMQCVCQAGMVLCQMKACSTFKCSGSPENLHSSSGTLASFGAQNPVSNEACCQRCAAWRKPRSDSSNAFDNNLYTPIKPRNLDTGVNAKDQTPRPAISPLASASSMESSITFRDGGAFGITSISNSVGVGDRSEKTTQYDDCVSGGRYYVHGATWHPIVGPFGTMECVSCKCNRGTIECGRLKCPSKKEMQCAKPTKVEGHCCPICTNLVSNDGGKFCVPGRQEVTALKSHGIGLNSTELITFAFVKDRRSGGTRTSSGQVLPLGPAVDLHEWTLQEGEVLQFSTRYISTEDLEKLKSRQTFTLLGATNEKNLDKFTRREKRLEKKCLTRCSARISSLERSLRIHRLVPRKQCLTHERSVTTS